MEETKRTRKEFVAYEYKEISGASEKTSFLIDSYECFGWEAYDERVEPGRSVHDGAKSLRVTVRMKRDRKIMNKMELTRLQRNFEACLKEIDMLEHTKTSKATTNALIMGVVGTAFMAGSVFAVTAPTPYIILCIILAVPAFICWILPYFVYKKTVRKQTERITPLIEAKYDEIYELCEKGNKLLY